VTIDAIVAKHSRLTQSMILSPLPPSCVLSSPGIASTALQTHSTIGSHSAWIDVLSRANTSFVSPQT
jgi:hypothetical protein